MSQNAKTKGRFHNPKVGTQGRLGICNDGCGLLFNNQERETSKVESRVVSERLGHNWMVLHLEGQEFLAQNPTT